MKGNMLAGDAPRCPMELTTRWSSHSTDLPSCSSTSILGWDIKIGTKKSFLSQTQFRHQMDPTEATTVHIQNRNLMAPFNTPLSPVTMQRNDSLRNSGLDVKINIVRGTRYSFYLTNTMAVADKRDNNVTSKELLRTQRP